MIDDPEDLNRRAAYLDGVRAIGANLRIIGYICCLLGVIVVALAGLGRIGDGPLSPPGIAGLVVIAAGWAIFAYVIWARARYIRTHPYKPEP